MAPIAQTDDGPEFGSISLQKHALLITRNDVLEGFEGAHDGNTRYVTARERDSHELRHELGTLPVFSSV